ncbi:MAG: hypothetical protein ABIA66_03435 [Candidatus Omnitrophota bacterium]
MEKQRPFGILIISRIQIIIGAIGIFVFTPLTVLELIGELGREHIGNEDYVGFTFDLILLIGSILDLTAGKLTYRLKPIGRILNLILAYARVLLYAALFLITGHLAGVGFWKYYRDFFHYPSLIVFYAIPFLWSLLVFCYFNLEKVKEQFK